MTRIDYLLIVDDFLSWAAGLQDLAKTSLYIYVELNHAISTLIIKIFYLIWILIS